MSEFMETAMQKVREMIDANTVIGEPITTEDGTMLIPVSKVSLGLAGGGGDNTKESGVYGVGGGFGAAVNIVPVAFVVVKGEDVQMLYVAPPEKTTLDKVIDTVPVVIDKITEFIDNKKEEE